MVLVLSSAMTTEPQPTQYSLPAVKPSAILATGHIARNVPFTTYGLLQRTGNRVTLTVTDTYCLAVTPIAPVYDHNDPADTADWAYLIPGPLLKRLERKYARWSINPGTDTLQLSTSDDDTSWESHVLGRNGTDTGPRFPEAGALIPAAGRPVGLDVPIGLAAGVLARIAKYGNREDLAVRPGREATDAIRFDVLLRDSDGVAVADHLQPFGVIMPIRLPPAEANPGE